jgi:ABC-type nitrate/sulfonate/bicarbonate transport system substrate-binding protein
MALVFSVSATKAFADELTKVRVGVAPYTMFQIWQAAKEFGIDKELGLDLELVHISATLPGVQALVRGDLDISSNCIAEHIAAIQNAPQVKGFSSLGFFQGFIFVGRKGEVKPIDELAEELGAEKAKEMRLNEFKGKEFCIIPQRKPLILDAIAQVGLTQDDVKFLNFADDQKAAMAFIRGSGDFYIGSLPQERKLIKMEDQFVNAGGAEILGPGGLWYDTMVSTDKFINENREAALRVLAVMYRSIRLFDENPQKVSQIGAAAISKLTGGDFSVDEYITMQTVYDDFLSIEQVKSGMFNSESELYWKPSAEYYVKLTAEEGDLDKEVNVDDYYPWEDLFFELLTRQDLMDKINAPFSS